LVVRLAARRVAQRLISLVDGLELVLGAGFLADVRMKFARETTICRFDFGIGRLGFHA